VPALALKELGHEVYVEDEFSFEWINEVDILVVQKQWSARAFNFIDTAIMSGVLTVNDVDENYWNLPEDHIEYNFWKEEEQVKFYNALLKRCWVITVPNEKLAEKVREFHQNVEVIPSSLPGKLWEKAYRKRRDYLKKKKAKPIIIGWVGSPLSVKNLELIHEPIRKILKKYSDVEVHIVGAPEGFVSWHPRVKIFSEWVRLEEYPTRLINFDIGLYPLLTDDYNRAKSDVKYLEYSYLAIPCVSSPFSGSDNFVKTEKNIFLAETWEQWEKALSLLIENKDLRERIGKSARRVALKRTIEKNVDKWLGVYEKYMKNFRELLPFPKPS
jgi:glycosyltransferase involved in cell wall biosynthesis